jgi:hypothetical protein
LAKKNAEGKQRVARTFLKKSLRRRFVWKSFQPDAKICALPLFHAAASDASFPAKEILLGDESIQSAAGVLVLDGEPIG